MVRRRSKRKTSFSGTAQSLGVSSRAQEAVRVGEASLLPLGLPGESIRFLPDGEVYPFDRVLPAEAHPRLAEPLRQLPVPILCNHCENQPCVRVCPTQATFQRPDGIVMMDYHRCIGCRFCMAACPYGSRSMNWRDPRPALAKLNPDYPTRTRGVVEKCNFCEERLAQGLLPACVLACRQKALVFGDLEEPGGEVRRLLEGKLSLRRRPELGTGPQVYYLL